MREPAVAGRFYPSDGDKLFDLLKSLFGRLPNEEGSRDMVGAVAPHAGYLASGATAAKAYKHILKDGLPDAYVIIGPDHHGIGKRCGICKEPYRTPLGTCEIHYEIAERLPFPEDPHLYEHSVEMQVPLIQFIDSSPKIVPIVISDQSLRSSIEIGRGIRRAIEGFDAIVIASSDMSHYVPKHIAARMDGRFIDSIASKDYDGMYGLLRKGVSACGYGAIVSAIEATSPSRIELLEYSDSWDSLGYDRDSVVGYASMAMMR